MPSAHTASFLCSSHGRCSSHLLCVQSWLSRMAPVGHSWSISGVSRGHGSDRWSLIQTPNSRGSRNHRSLYQSSPKAHLCRRRCFAFCWEIIWWLEYLSRKKTTEVSPGKNSTHIASQHLWLSQREHAVSFPMGRAKGKPNTRQCRDSVAYKAICRAHGTQSSVLSVQGRHWTPKAAMVLLLRGQ